VVVNDEYLDVIRLMELFLDPLVVLAAHAALVQIGLRGVDRNDGKSSRA
jgi:hypothetical protein